ncbi:C5a anaphylatoxin chemotactic receptor 1 [Anguilla rostrata]|uniref:C5a anaphylatoxin chemotactic receptor 1 n=1 Tax=Anguilla rostrata TaxID=7938 RepID=UPI0030D1B34B
MAEGVTSLGGLNGTLAPPDPALAGGGDPPTDVWRVVQMVITVVIFLVGIPLNGLVVWVLGVRGGRQGGPGGEEPRGAGTFRMYVVHLALADLLLVLRIPLMLGYLAAHYSWPFGLAVCRLVMFLRGLGLYANAFLLCAISAERCLCLLHPVWFRMRRPRWTVPLVCALLWLLATVLSTPYLVTSAVVPRANRSQCLESSGSAPGLLITETVLGFILPLLLFLTSNLAVLVTARQAGGAVPTSPTTAPTSKRMVRLYRVLFLTMLLFLTCWVPYFTFRFLLRLAASHPDRAWLLSASVSGVYVSLYLVYAKSALNPVIYVFAARGLSRTVRASVFSAVDRIFNEDTSDYARRRSLRRTDSQI